MTKVPYPFGFERPKDSPGFMLWQTTMMWQRLIKRALEPYGITHPQFVIMALLLWLGLQKKTTTQVQIAAWSQLDKMTVSQSLKKLTQAGFVERWEDTIDTRAKNVELTATGKSLINTLIPIVENIDAEFFSALSKKDEPTFIHMIQRLTGDASK